MQSKINGFALSQSKGENKLLLNQSSHKYEKTASIGTCKCYLFEYIEEEKLLILKVCRSP